MRIKKVKKLLERKKKTAKQLNNSFLLLNAVKTKLLLFKKQSSKDCFLCKSKRLVILTILTFLTTRHCLLQKRYFKLDKLISDIKKA